MLIIVNGKKLDLKGSPTVLNMLELINVTSISGIAIAVNNSVVIKGEWDNFVLRENDSIVLIRATQGG